MHARFAVILMSGSAIAAFAPADAQTAPAGPPAPASQATSTPTHGLSALGEIIVTAQRRSQNLQDVPVAVTALGQQAIASARITGVANLTGISPNVTINDQGDPSAPSITIRGIGCCATLNAVDPKVGIYVDGVYIGRATGGLFDLADIERIEILRGPQGTLFGRNATAGAVSIITPEPSGEFHLKQDLSYGNFGAWRARTALDLPALGPLSVSISYLHDQTDGYARNALGGMKIDFSQATGGRYGTLTAANRLGASNTDAVRVAAKLDLTDDLKLDYKFDFSDMHATPEPAQVFGFSSGAGGIGAEQIFAYQPLLGGHANLAVTPLDTVYNFSTDQHLQVGGHSLTATWHPADHVTLKSISAYRWYEEDPNAFDLAATGGLMLPDATGAITPYATLLSVRQSQQHQFTEELQLSITSRHFDLVAGGFYFHERAPAFDPLFTFQNIPNGVAPAPGSGITDSISRNESKAVYAQATYHVTSKLDLTGGIRSSWDNRFVDIYSLQGNTGANVGLGQHTTDFSHVDYTGIVTYKPVRDVTAYTKVATGYVSGGIVAGIAFKPETLRSYEVGIKSELFDRRLRANVDAYYMDYSNLQVQQFFNGGLIYQNAGKATVKGVEGEFQAVPARGVTLGLNFGYQSFIYNSYILGGVDIGRDGLDIATSRDTPHWNLMLSGEYALEPMADGATPFLHLDARYRSKAAANLTEAGVPATDAVVKLDPYWIVNGRIGLRSLTIGSVKTDVSMFVMNMFNERKILFANDLSSVVAGTYVHPRTYGVDLSVKF